DACASATEFTSHLTKARMNRDTFCETNPSDTICDTLNLCNANPFATGCEMYFQTDRTTLCGGPTSTDFDTCVNVGDLPTYPIKPSGITKSGFLTGIETGLNTTDIQDGGAHRTISTPLFIGRRGGAGSTNPDGFAYFDTNNTSSVLAYSYVGILPTTNLGAPLAAQPTAVWAGHFSVGETTNVAVNYYVNFSTGRFGFSNAGGDGFGTQTVNISGADRPVTLNAVFGSHADAMGYSAGRMGGTIDIDTVTDIPLIGLIGAEGAVGVFTEIRQNPFSGGFTATNPN
ncbi:MAG: hypothetical protein K8953_01105, partial [Proteobacteria bacterium]|nr:hypothetical protein [Pseudomonadota bacterium]